MTPADCEQYKQDLTDRLQKINEAKEQLKKAYDGPKNALKVKVAAAKTKEEKAALVLEIKDLKDPEKPKDTKDTKDTPETKVVPKP